MLITRCEGRLGVTARAMQVKSNLQINWLCRFLITGMCLVSPNVQSAPAIRKIQDRGVNIPMSHLVGTKES